MSNPMSVYPVLFIMKRHPLSCVLMMHSCRLFHLATYLNTFPSTPPSPSTSSGGGGELSLSIDTIFELFDLDVIWLCFQS